MKTINWGSIGCGDVCERKSGPALYGVENSSLVAVTRRDREKGEDFAKRHNVPRYYGTTEELLADDEIAAVYVATPGAEHYDPTVAAARAGRHVLCEKPMARNADECRGMIDICNEAGVELGVAYYRRCYPIIMKVRELVDAGAYGAVKEIRINDEFPLSHRLDLIHYFCGDIAAVSSKNEKLVPGSHATEGGVLYARTENGPVGVMNIGWGEKLAPETVFVTCENGRINVDDLKAGELSIESEGKTEKRSFGPLAATHWGLVENFVQHLNGNADLACDGEEGRKSTVILDIVSLLENDGAEIEVDYANPPAPRTDDDAKKLLG